MMTLRSLLQVALLTLAISGCTSSAPSPVSARWLKRFGDNRASVAAFSVDASGNTAMTGAFSGLINFGGKDLTVSGADSAAFMAMLDVHGHHRWSKTIGGPGAPLTRGIATGSEGMRFVAGSFGGTIDVDGDTFDALSSDTFLLALDATGNVHWRKHWSADDGGPSGAGTSDPSGGVAIDKEGNVILAGQFTGTFGFGGDPLDATPQSAFITKLRPDGSLIWSHIYGGEGIKISVTSLVADPDGDILIAGGVEWDSGPWVPPGAFVARFDPEGALRWDIRATGSGSSVTHGIALDPDGDVIAVGSYTDGNMTFATAKLTAGDSGAMPFVIELSAAGKVKWAATFGEGDATTADAVTADARRVIVSGTYTDTLGGKLPERDQPTAYLLSLDPKGSVRTITSLGAPAELNGSSNVPCLALQGSDLVLAGAFGGELTVRGDTLSSNGLPDAFVGRVKP